MARPEAPAPLAAQPLPPLLRGRAAEEASAAAPPLGAAGAAEGDRGRPPWPPPRSWQRAQLKAIVADLGLLAVRLAVARDGESGEFKLGECNAESCPEMAVQDRTFLCSAHPEARPCCAHDYTIHTLDGCTAVLNSAQFFPPEDAEPASPVTIFPSIARRLHRACAHAFYHHRATFDAFERKYRLHARLMHLAGMHGWLQPKHCLFDKELLAAGERSAGRTGGGGGGAASPSALTTFLRGLDPPSTFADPEEGG